MPTGVRVVKGIVEKSQVLNETGTSHPDTRVSRVVNQIVPDKYVVLSPLSQVDAVLANVVNDIVVKIYIVSNTRGKPTNVYLKSVAARDILYKVVCDEDPAGTGSSPT